jgi:hypothetical protein
LQWLPASWYPPPFATLVFSKRCALYCYGAGVLIFIFWHEHWLVSFGSCSTVVGVMVAAVVSVTIILWLWWFRLC